MNKTIIVVLLIIVTNNAFACWCGEVSKEKHFENSTQVFLGVVANISTITTLMKKGPREFSRRENNIEFLVDETFKGISKKTIDVYSATSGSACGIDFQKGKAYLVFSYRIPEEYIGNKPEGSLGVSSCGMTFQISKNRSSLNRSERNTLAYLRVNKVKGSKIMTADSVKEMPLRLQQ